MASQTKSVPKKETPISVCDVMKGNTSKTIQKMEAQIPSYVQLYSDFYSEYLHAIDDLFGTCYIAEKEFFENLKIDENVLNAFKQFTDSMTSNYITNIEMSTQMLRSYIQTRILGIRTYDTYLHNLMESYAQGLSVYNRIFKK